MGKLISLISHLQNGNDNICVTEMRRVGKWGMTGTQYTVNAKFVWVFVLSLLIPVTSSLRGYSIWNAYKTTLACIYFYAESLLHPLFSEQSTGNKRTGHILAQNEIFFIIIIFFWLGIVPVAGRARRHSNDTIKLPTHLRRFPVRLKNLGKGLQHLTHRSLFNCSLSPPALNSEWNQHV